MSRRAVQRYKSGKHLLKRLTDNPALPTYVPTLLPATLNRVIQEIGVEDSAELIELSTPDQMVAIVNDAVWHSDLPGVPESFHSQEFLRWLEVMLEVGEEFTAERLTALGDDVLATAFSHFLTVGGPTQGTPSTAEATEAYGPYVVRPKAEEDWDVLSAMLNALHENEPQLLQVLLLRCRLGLGHSRDSSTAEMDAAFEHEIDREARGFVTPQSARVFLDSIRNSTLTLLCAESEYDLASARYFRLVERARKQAATTSSTDLANHEAASDVNSEPTISPADVAALEQTIGELEPEVASPLLLTGPETLDQATALQHALTALTQTEPDTFARRMAEGAYLSNILLSGATLDGKHFSESEAAAAVLATCNLGLDYLAETELANDAGLVRLFRVGWHVIQTIPLDVARRLVAITQLVDASASLRGWMFSEINDLLSKEEFLKDIAAGRFNEVRETVEMLQLLISSSHASALGALVNDTPRLLKSRPTDADSDTDSVEMRFIETLDDLDQIDRLIAAVQRELDEL